VSFPCVRDLGRGCELNNLILGPSGVDFSQLVKILGRFCKGAKYLWRRSLSNWSLGR